MSFKRCCLKNRQLKMGAKMRQKMVLSKLFGESPKIKVVNFLLNGREFDYSISDISEGSEIARMTAYDVVKDLVKKRFVKKTRKQGVSPLYKINMESEEVKILFEAYRKLLKKNLKELKRGD